MNCSKSFSFAYDATMSPCNITCVCVMRLVCVCVCVCVCVTQQLKRKATAKKEPSSNYTNFQPKLFCGVAATLALAPTTILHLPSPHVPVWGAQSLPPVSCHLLLCVSCEGLQMYLSHVSAVHKHLYTTSHWLTHHGTCTSHDPSQRSTSLFKWRN